MFNRASGSASPISRIVPASRSRPRAKINAASTALSTTDSASGDGGSTARSTRPLCESSHCPSVNGAHALGSIGIPALADRTAATTHPDDNAGATEANDASPTAGGAAPPARHRAVEESDAPPVGVEQPVFLLAR